MASVFWKRTAKLWGWQSVSSSACPLRQGARGGRDHDVQPERGWATAFSLLDSSIFLVRSHLRTRDFGSEQEKTVPQRVRLVSSEQEKTVPQRVRLPVCTQRHGGHGSHGSHGSRVRLPVCTGPTVTGHGGALVRRRRSVNGRALPSLKRRRRGPRLRISPSVGEADTLGQVGKNGKPVITLSGTRT